MIDTETIKLCGAIAFALLVKSLLTDDGAVPNETPLQKRRRIRKGLGGIGAGGLIAFFGYEPLIRWLPMLTPEDAKVVAIMLAFTGEHITRWLLSAGPELFTKIVERSLGGGKS